MPFEMGNFNCYKLGRHQRPDWAEGVGVAEAVVGAEMGERVS